ncbi:hypothetical protein [Salinivibrio phage CW02]|uniref:Uncharacterized protein n=1 Tax=Salinivibrio phage CW02 TaxID=1161935 RepID=H9D1E2_9CAUD|nr:hypothetical protein F490_gp53 [Salinivibrio phage CW02]AFE86184.1 hypothetical protein [Salinivibrio phage CW02]
MVTFSKEVEVEIEVEPEDIANILEEEWSEQRIADQFNLYTSEEMDERVEQETLPLIEERDNLEEELENVKSELERLRLSANI